MLTDYKEKLIRYKTTMTMFKSMLKKGIITAEDYAKIDTIMTEKYGIKSSNIFQ